MPKGLKTLLIIIAISFVAFIGWKIIAGSDDSSEAGLTSTVGSASSPSEQQVISLLLRLQSIQLDGTFLTDPLFESLLETSVVISQQPATRRNPFLPIGQSDSRTDPVDGHVTITPSEAENDQAADPLSAGTSDSSATSSDQSDTGEISQ
jgi:hypothetical protein